VPVHYSDHANCARRLTEGYHGLGFSQGALFLRGLAQTCAGPPMRSLVSIGGPHQGKGNVSPKIFIVMLLFKGNHIFEVCFFPESVFSMPLTDISCLEDSWKHACVNSVCCVVDTCYPNRIN